MSSRGGGPPGALPEAARALASSWDSLKIFSRGPLIGTLPVALVEGPPDGSLSPSVRAWGPRGAPLGATRQAGSCVISFLNLFLSLFGLIWGPHTGRMQVSILGLHAVALQRNKSPSCCSCFLTHPSAAAIREAEASLCLSCCLCCCCASCCCCCCCCIDTACSPSCCSVCCCCCSCCGGCKTAAPEAIGCSLVGLSLATGCDAISMASRMAKKRARAEAFFRGPPWEPCVSRGPADL